MKNTKAISLSLIFIIALSISSSYGDAVLPNYKKEATPPIIVEALTNVKLTKDFTLSLEEKKFQFTNQEVTLILKKQPRADHITNLHISEDVTMSNNDGSGNQIYLIKHNNNQAILERIFNYRKFQFDKMVGLPLSTTAIGSLYHSIIGSLNSDTGNDQNSDFDQISLEIGRAHV